MKVRIAHTADNHIGIKYSSSRYSPQVRSALINERFSALERVVNESNKRKAHFLVVAGDLFDSLYIPNKDIQKVVDILHTFEGEAVLVLPGNHDFYDGEESSLWNFFKKIINEQKIFLLNKTKPFEFLLGEERITFYPCPCPCKHSDKNMIGWVSQVEMDEASLNIGIAHGNVEGLGIGADKYFNMKQVELRSAGVDLWLLGHIHVPYPLNAQQTNPGFFFPGTHAPDGFHCWYEGSCWFYEISNKQVVMEKIITGNIRYLESEEEIKTITDFKKVTEQFSKPENMFLRITFKGTLPKEELDQVIAGFESFRQKFLYCEINNLLTLHIDLNYINSNFAIDSIPYVLLTSLENSNDEEALQLAFNLMEELKK